METLPVQRRSVRPARMPGWSVTSARRAANVRAERTDVVVARSFEELERLRPAWETLQGSMLNTDPDFFATVCRGRGDRPHVVLLFRGDEPRALAIGRIGNGTLPIRLGGRMLWNPGVRSLTVVFGGILGDPEQADADRLLTELRATLVRGEADVLRLRSLGLDSPLYRAATSAGSSFTRQPLSRRSTHWELELPTSLDVLLGSRKKSVRQNFRTSRNRLDREFGDRWSIRVFRDPDEIDEMFDQIGTVAPRTYQAGQGVAFAPTPLQRSLTELAMARGWFRAYVISIDGRPVAFWHGNAYRGRFNLETPGYDPAYKHLSVGSYLLLRLIGDLCEDETVRVFDFGFGDADYKRRLADRSWFEEDVLVFAPNAKMIAINLLRSGLLVAGGVARRLLDRAGASGRVKRWWRNRLVSRAASQAFMQLNAK